MPSSSVHLQVFISSVCVCLCAFLIKAQASDHADLHNELVLLALHPPRREYKAATQFDMQTQSAQLVASRPSKEFEREARRMSVSKGSPTRVKQGPRIKHIMSRRRRRSTSLGVIGGIGDDVRADTDSFINLAGAVKPFDKDLGQGDFKVAPAEGPSHRVALVTSRQALDMTAVASAPTASVASTVPGAAMAVPAIPTAVPIPVIEHTEEEIAARKEEVAHGDAGAHGEGSHGESEHSIFRIEVTQLDNLYFHLILVGMLVFTIVIDRLEWFADRAVKGNRANEMFLARVNSEIMMFGFVGLGVFLFSQIFNPPEEKFIFFEFVDIFCSLGAVILIFMAGALFAMKRRMERQWLSVYDSGGEQRWLDELRAATSIVQVDRQGILCHIMGARFRALHKLANEFDFSLYLQDSLAKNVCDLMNVNWITWVVLLILTLAWTIFRMFLGHLFVHHTAYMNLYAGGIWLTWLLHVSLEWVSRASWRTLERNLGGSSLSTLRKALEDAIKLAHGADDPTTKMEKVKQGMVQPFASRHADWLEQTTQIVAICSAFEGAGYLMHIMFNIRHHQMSAWWHAVFIVPLCLNLFVHLPGIMSHYSTVQAYFCPDGDVMDATLAAAHQVEQDLLFVRKQLQARGDWQRDSPHTFGSVRALAVFLRGVSVHISDTRVRRLFSALDKDASGGLGADEFAQAIQQAI